ncbi:MAG: beta/gamma crystallin-related protein [Betaproteobacteria bacterium]
MNLGRMLVASAAMSCAVLVAAQEIILYQDDNFSGPRYSANTSVPDLGGAGFNDRASSVTIRGGSWQLCADSWYRGQCVTLNPGDYRSLSAMGLNDRVSSLREISWNGGGGGGGGGGGFIGGSIVLYDSPGMTGRSYTLNGPTPNLDGTGFNDRATSAYVNSGTWQLCADANYMSSCEVVGPGAQPNLGGVTGRVSSARPMAAGGGGGGGGGPGPGAGGGGGNWGGGSRVVLYEGQNFSGRSYTVNSDVLNNLGNTGFNDRAASIRVERGYWLFCTDANFLGECRTFGPGDYPTLAWLSNRISSGRRISNDYPYNAPPRWQ